MLGVFGFQVSWYLYFWESSDFRRLVFCFVGGSQVLGVFKFEYFGGSSGFRCAAFYICGSLQVSGVLILVFWVCFGFRCLDLCILGGLQVLGILSVVFSGFSSF